ncbi:MAG: PHP domain-containing protein [Chloroflexota bacterium]
MLRVEFHCHTIYSKDSLTTPQRLVEVCRRKGIDRVVVTDHNTIAGARACQALDPERVIIGEEVLTTRGELLAAFVTEELPPGLSPLETIERLRGQGAFISVSHPFDVMRRGHWEPADLLEILPLVDAIETFNSRCWSPEFNRRALEFARQHRIPGTVGSDAHAAFELGRATLTVSGFTGPDELRRVIGQGQARTRWSPPWVHLTSRYAVFVKKLQRESS